MLVNIADCLLIWSLEWFFGFCILWQQCCWTVNYFWIRTCFMNEYLQLKLDWLTSVVKELWSFLMSGTVDTTTHCHIQKTWIIKYPLVLPNVTMFVWLQVSQGGTVRPTSMNACRIPVNMEVTVWTVLTTTRASVAALGECWYSCSNMWIEKLTGCHSELKYFLYLRCAL